MRAIDADDLLKKGIKVTVFGVTDIDVLDRMMSAFREAVITAPTVKAEPEHGHWIEHPFSAVFEKVHSKDQIVCSCCEEAFNAFFNETERFKYCPNCGAKMDERKEE